MESLCKVLGPGQSENSGEQETQSCTLLSFNYTAEEECNVNLVQNKSNEGGNAINISNISFIEPLSPINQTALEIAEIKLKEGNMNTSNNSGSGADKSQQIQSYEMHNESAGGFASKLKKSQTL